MDFIELLKFLKTCETAEQIDEKREEILELLPEMKPMVDFDQKMNSQCFDLWEHSLNTVARLPKDLPDDMPNNLLYFAGLIHDIGKPQTQAADPKKPEYMVYKGHCEKGVQILEESIFPRINQDKEVLSESERNCIKYYVLHHHDQPARLKKFARRQMKITTYEQFLNLMKLEIADCKAQYKCRETEERVQLSEYVLDKGEKDVASLFVFSKWLF